MRKHFHFCILFLFLFTNKIFSQKTPLPNPAQLAWQQAELGVVFHYDLHVFDGENYGQGKNRIEPVKDYNIFNPTRLDTDQWIRTAKSAGARFAILTVTHETGFALYPSDANPYNTRILKWKDGKGDIVRDFVNSCRKYGIEPGLYIGIRWNSLLGVHDFKTDGQSAFAKNRQAYYNNMVERMVTELCTRYGKLFEIWFDGGASDPALGAPDVLPIVKKYQPECLFYWNAQLAEARWGGTESGTVSYPCWATFPHPSTFAPTYPEIEKNNYALLRHGDANGQYWIPAMSDAPLRGHNGKHDWFWEPNSEAHVYPADSLVNMYYKSVGRNSTLILGITPDTAGLVPRPDSLALAAFGDKIKKQFSAPVGTAKNNSLVIQTKNKVKTNCFILQEDIRQGEHIRQYSLQAKINNRWKTIATGESVGHKRIQTFEPVSSSSFRIVVDRTTAKPVISNFQLFNID